MPGEVKEQESLIVNDWGKPWPLPSESATASECVAALNLLTFVDLYLHDSRLEDYSALH